MVANQSLTFEHYRKRATNSQLAKWTALGIRWPVLAEELRKRPNLLRELEEWARKGTIPVRPWHRRIDDLATDPDFKEGFMVGPELGDADLHGLLIVQ